MRLRVGYSPWEGWDCHLVMPTPWWYVPVVTFLERWAERFSGWPTVHDAIWAVRSPIARRHWVRRGEIWWEYRAA